MFCTGLKRLLILLCLAVAALPVRVLAESQSARLRHDDLLRASQLLLAMRIPEGQALIDRWIATHPDDPSGYFFRSSALSWQLFLLPHDSSPDSLKAEFDKALKASRRVAEKAAGRRETRFEGTVYLGATCGSEALLAMLDERYLAMAPLAKQAWVLLQQAVAEDPEYYDSYFGLGIYLYFTDVLPRIVKVLAEAYGFEGDRARGLACLRLAIDRGTYSTDAARIMLINIYSDLETPDSSIVAVARDLYARYPDNPLIHWRYGDILYRDREYAAAEEVFSAVLDRLDRKYPGYDNSMFTRWSMVFRLGLCARKLGRTAEATGRFEGILAAGAVKPSWIVSAARIQCGEIYLEEGKRDLARSTLEPLLDGPDHRGSRDRAKILLKQLND